MVDELQPAYDAFRIDSHHDMDGLAGIADGACDVGIEIRVTQQAFAAEDGCDRGIAGDLAEAGCTWKNLLRLHLLKIVGQLARGHAWAGQQHSDAESDEAAQKALE